MTSYSSAGGPAGYGRARWQGCGAGFRWKPAEIAAMVLGFVFWWPVGLAVLAYKIAQKRGYSMDDAMTAVRSGFSRGGQAPSSRWQPFREPSATGNAAFDEWRAAELAKLEEERRKLDTARRDFAEHLDNLRRARDREEFDGFMRAREQSRQTPPSEPSA